MTTTTVADLGAEHLNRVITLSGEASEQRRWSVTGRLSAVAHAATPDDEDQPGLRSTELSLGVGDASLSIELEPDHPVSIEN